MKKFYVSKSRIGKGIFASRDIKKNEQVLVFSGKRYSIDRNETRPFSNVLENHAVQIGPYTWIYSKNDWNYTNHSCEPNCGIKGVSRLVAMRDIRKGEEITYDYAMTENGKWRMRCLCRTKSCRKIVGSWSMLPLRTKRKYRNWTSSWILKRNKF